MVVPLSVVGGKKPIWHAIGKGDQSRRAGSGRCASRSRNPDRIGDSKAHDCAEFLTLAIERRGRLDPDYWPLQGGL